MDMRYINRIDAPRGFLIDGLIRTIASVVVRKADAIEMDAVLNDNREATHTPDIDYLIGLSRQNQKDRRKGWFQRDPPLLAIPVPLDDVGIRVFVELAPLTIGARAYRAGALVFDVADGGTELETLLDPKEFAEVDEWLKSHGATSSDFLELTR